MAGWRMQGGSGEEDGELSGCAVRVGPLEH